MSNDEKLPSDTNKDKPKKSKKAVFSIITSMFVIIFISVIILIIIPDDTSVSSENPSYTEKTTSVYENKIEIENGKDNPADNDISFTQISLSDNALSEFESYLSFLSVDYDFADSYNIESALKLYNDNTVNSVKNHSHDIRVNGEFDDKELYKIVKKNNNEYINKKNEEYMGTFFEEYSDREIRKICTQMCDALSEIAAKDKTVDIDTVCCYLSNLVILKSFNTGFDYGGFAMDNRFYMNYDIIDNFSIGVDTEDLLLTTFYHEMMHAFQFACDDMKKVNEDRIGICHIYNELEINPFSWYWLLEASAEMNMSQHLGVDYTTYKSRITYVDTLNFISNISQGEELIQTEKICFQRDTDRFFKQLDMSSPDEIHEIIKMMFNLEIMHEKNSGFFNWYNKTYNVDLSADEGEKTFLFLTVKEDSLLTLTKMFYRNLARQINNGNVTLQDAYYLIRLMEADLDRHFSNYIVGYMLFFHNFYDTYISIQDEFFRIISSENNLTSENLINGFEKYSMISKSGNDNFSLEFLSQEKQKYITDYFVNSFYKKGYPSIRNCQEQVNELSKTVSIDEMIKNRLLKDF